MIPKDVAEAGDDGNKRYHKKPPREVALGSSELGLLSSFF